MSDLVTISSTVVSSIAALISALAALATVVWQIHKEKKTPPAAGGIFRFILLFIGFSVGMFILITYFIYYVQKYEVPSQPIIRTVPPQ